MSTSFISAARVTTVAQRLLIAVFALVLLFVFVSFGPRSVSAQTIPPQHPALGASQALGLSKFKAIAKKGKVNLAWQTESETTILGFHVWRRAAGAQYKRLDDSLIAALHVGEIAGATYSMTDKTVKSGKTYFYQLEVVGTNGDSNWTEELKVKVK